MNSRCLQKCWTQKKRPDLRKAIDNLLESLRQTAYYISRPALFFEIAYTIIDKKHFPPLYAIYSMSASSKEGIKLANQKALWLARIQDGDEFWGFKPAFKKGLQLFLS